jgi:hypothetical protein
MVGCRGPDLIAERTAAPLPEPDEGPCERCGVHALAWRRCKLICVHCGTIVKSCADL